MRVKIFSKCKIQPNHYIENLVSYLDTTPADREFEITTSKEFISDKDSFSIRVELNKDSLQLDDLGTWNYCKISTGLYDEGKPSTTIENDIIRYYFITGFRNISQFIYEFDLSLDVVNTYQNDLTNVNNFKQVSVKRRHKNRFHKNGQYYYRNYDEVDEGFGNVVSEVENKEEVFNDETYVVSTQLEGSDSNAHYDSTFDVYIPHSMIINRIYKNKATETIVASNHIDNTTCDSSTDKLKHCMFAYCNSADDYLFVSANVAGKQNYDVLANAVLLVPRMVSTSFYYDWYFGFVQNESFKIEGMVSKAVDGVYPLQMANMNSTGSFTCWYTSSGSRDYNKKYAVGDSISFSTLFPAGGTKVGSTKKEEHITLPALGSLNKSDSTIKTITAMPFEPTRYGMCNISSSIGVVAGKTVVENYNIFNLKNNYLDSLPTDTIVTRDKKYESKLYGSYVRSQQLVYDTFSLPIQPEYYSEDRTTTTIYGYKPIDATNDLAFRFDFLTEQQVNSNVLACNRNNTVPTWTNDYLEYVKNGYNYDNKTNTLSNIKNAVSVATNLGGTFAGKLGKAASMGTGLAGFQTVQMGVQTASSLTGAIFSGIENARALEQKRTSLMTTSPTMSGSDNLSVFKTINNGHKVYFVTSKPTDEVLDNIYNLFYYTGYADNMYYSTMPTIKTRQYFNYVQADIAYCTITNPKERQRLIDAFSNGITFEWKYNNTWLLEGNEYENWETAI